MTVTDGPKPDHENTNIYPLLKRLFGEYLVGRNLTTADAEQVKLEEFVEFLLKDEDIPWGPICQELNMDSVIRMDLQNILAKEGTLPGMKEQWMGFVMGCRPAPKNPLGAIQLVVNLRFRDGKMVPMTCYIPEELSEPITDAGVCLAVQQQFQAIYDTVVTKGIDGLYEDGFFPKDPNVALRHKSQTPGPPIFPPEVREQILAVRAMKGYESLCPPHPLEALTDPKATAGVTKEQARMGQVQGGFDAPAKDNPES